MTVEILDWEEGETITRPGLYKNIPLDRYHNDTTLLSGPSVSKSSIKHIAPPSGSPKRFWQNYPGNPNRLKKPSSREMDFGKAVHAILLGDEVFQDRFVVMPEIVEGETYNKNKTVWKNWFKRMEANGLVVISQDQIDQIALMAEDARQHPLVVNGGLNGDVEISMFAKDPATGIWLKSRPDVRAIDGDFVDVKTASSLDPDFLERQIGDMGYYLQGAMTKIICDLLRIPFNSFTFFYTLSKEYADSDYRVLSEEEILVGTATINYGLKHIRHGLDNGQWPGVSIYARENTPIRMNKFDRETLLKAIAMDGFRP
jgi:hypothetical protein